MPIKKDSKGLTIKQRKFVEEYVKTGDKTVAYKEAYDTKGNLSTIQPEAVRTANIPQVRNAIDEALAKQDIDIDLAIAPIGKALRAKLAFMIDGQRVETDYDDLDMQLKGSDRVIKLMGLGQKEVATPAAVHFHQHIEDKKNGYSF